MKIGDVAPHKKIGAPKHPCIHFCSENSHSAIFGLPLRGNEEEFWENYNNWYNYNI